MLYPLRMLWHERNRYLPAVGAVSFGGVLIVMQVGLLLGIFTEVGIPVDQSRAHIWVGDAGVRTADVTLPIPARWQTLLASQPEVERVESYIRTVSYVRTNNGGIELVAIIGTRLDDEALGPIPALTPELRARLAEPNTFVVDESEMPNLGLTGIGDHLAVNGHRVRMVGTIRWMKGMASAYVFCSISTAQRLLGTPSSQVSFLLARCRNAEDAPAVVQRLRSYGNMGVYTREELSFQSRLEWLVRSRAGIALLFAALLGLLVGTGVTSQTLYAATAASTRQYAVLEALGIPGWRMKLVVLIQSLWVGVAGMVLAAPVVLACVGLVQASGGRVVLPVWVLIAAAILTLVMAVLSGLLALRSLRLAEPANLLR